MADSLERTTFSRMQDGSADDYQIIAAHQTAAMAGRVQRILDHLELLAGDSLGYAIDRLAHSLQSATRAQRDGRDEEYVVCALLHDIGDTLAAANHSELAAVVLEPYVGEKEHWIVKHHGIFQGYYFFEHFGLDKNMREQYRSHEYFDDCAEFCELYDENCFDSKYQNLPLSFFRPMVESVFSAPKKSIYLPEPNP
jgi:predicted HD phosphohydrolase